jgi:hypothetical protein
MSANAHQILPACSQDIASACQETPAMYKAMLPCQGSSLQCRKLDNGKVRWQGWYPGAVPASHSVTRRCGHDAYNEVMKWIYNQHEKKNPSS